MRTRTLLTLDQQDGSSDSIPRVAGNGSQRTMADRSVPDPRNGAFFARVNECFVQLRAGQSVEDVHQQHGLIVLREAQRRIEELPLAVVLADAAKIEREDRGRPKVMRPCRWCGVEFGARGMITHLRHCDKKPK